MILKSIIEKDKISLIACFSREPQSPKSGL